MSSHASSHNVIINKPSAFDPVPLTAVSKTTHTYMAARRTLRSGKEFSSFDLAVEQAISPLAHFDAGECLKQRLLEQACDDNECPEPLPFWAPPPPAAATPSPRTAAAPAAALQAGSLSVKDRSKTRSVRRRISSAKAAALELDIDAAELRHSKLAPHDLETGLGGTSYTQDEVDALTGTQGFMYINWLGELRKSTKRLKKRLQRKQHRGRDADNREVLHKRKFIAKFGEDTFYDYYLPHLRELSVAHLPGVAQQYHKDMANAPEARGAAVSSCPIFIYGTREEAEDRWAANCCLYNTHGGYNEEAEDEESDSSGSSASSPAPTAPSVPTPAPSMPCSTTWGCSTHSTPHKAARASVKRKPTRSSIKRDASEEFKAPLFREDGEVSLLRHPRKNTTPSSPPSLVKEEAKAPHFKEGDEAVHLVCPPKCSTPPSPPSSRKRGTPAHVHSLLLHTPGLATKAARTRGSGSPPSAHSPLPCTPELTAKSAHARTRAFPPSGLGRLNFLGIQHVGVHGFERIPCRASPSLASPARALLLWGHCTSS
ncbi:hypothetical protein C8R44DRAFT_865069 [Mycena epipterygia]|nr:hypothetical protein C8R44DRAFT_865069 [Mycena epipterygia]